MPAPDSRPRWATTLERHAPAIVVGLTLFALVVRLLPALSLPVWHDEVETWLASRVSPMAFVFWNAHPIHPPVSFLIVRLSTEILGSDAGWALRFPAVLAGTLAVPVGYWVGRSGISRRFGVGFAALLAVSPQLVLQGHTARMYPLVVLSALVAFAWLLRLEGREGRHPWHWLGLGLVLAVAVGSHYLGLAVWLGSVAAILWRARDHGGWGDPMVRGIAMASLPPVAMLIAGSDVLELWSGVALRTYIPNILSGGFALHQNVPVDVPVDALPWIGAVAVVLAGVIAVGVIGLRRIHRRRPLLASLLAWTAGLSIPIALVGAFFLLLAIARYMILFEVAILAGIAAFAFEGTSRRALAFGLFVVGIQALAALDLDRREPWHDLGEVAERVAERRSDRAAMWYYPCHHRVTGHYYGLSPKPPPSRSWTFSCTLEEYPPVGEAGTWLIVGHISAGDDGLHEVTRRLEENYGVSGSFARIDSLLHRYGAVAARFGPGKLDLVLPARPSRDAIRDPASEAD